MSDKLKKYYTDTELRSMSIEELKFLEESLDEQLKQNRISELKEHLKKKITRNNEKLNEHYTTSVDSLTDDDGQSGVLGVEQEYFKTSSDAEDLSYENDIRKDI